MRISGHSGEFWYPPATRFQVFQSPDPHNVTGCFWPSRCVPLGSAVDVRDIAFLWADTTHEDALPRLHDPIAA